MLVRVLYVHTSHLATPLRVPLRQCQCIDCLNDANRCEVATKEQQASNFTGRSCAVFMSTVLHVRYPQMAGWLRTARQLRNMSADTCTQPSLA